MSTDLSQLKPSNQAPIDLETLRGLPLGVPIFVGGDLAFLCEWRCRSAPMGLKWLGEDFLSWHDPRPWEIRYPKLPRLQFTLTTEQIATPGDQPSGRCKSVTRRKQWPPGIRPGALFLAIDRGRRSRKQAPSRGLGVFRTTSVETVGRMECYCERCEGIFGYDLNSGAACPECRPVHHVSRRDTLTPAELELEGFPDLSADRLWELLVKAGNVAEDGTVCRIAFEAVQP